MAEKTETKDDAAALAIAAGMRVYGAIPQLSRLRDEVLMGDVWKQPEMNARDRSLVTCVTLAVQGRDEELAVHVARAIANGVTRDELRGAVVQLAMYAGWPTGVALGKALLPHLTED